mgnify:CR=1 FL=1|tara:strand:- start:1333 stop:1740 length:408 start_codon:yes stop_codon:yes gene_type:complete
MEDSHKIKKKVFLLYMSIVIIIMFLSITCNGQMLITDKTFTKSQSGITVVEFWSDWNKENECFWLEDISNAKTYRIDLESQTADDYEIKVLPTLIVFNNGEEIDRFEGNISFQLCPRRTPKKVQKVIDGLMINKF